jgi:hypothetical protein
LDAFTPPPRPDVASHGQLTKRPAFLSVVFFPLHREHWSDIHLDAETNNIPLSIDFYQSTHQILLGDLSFLQQRIAATYARPWQRRHRPAADLQLAIRHIAFRTAVQFSHQAIAPECDTFRSFRRQYIRRS